MHFLIDECVSKKTALLLKDLGCEISTTKDLKLEGKSDSNIFQTAVSKKLVLITVDKDFANILLYPPETHYGIIVLKLTKETEEKINLLLSNFIKNTKSKIIKGTLIIIDKNKIRIRTS